MHGTMGQPAWQVGIVSAVARWSSCCWQLLMQLHVLVFILVLYMACEPLQPGRRAAERCLGCAVVSFHESVRAVCNTRIPLAKNRLCS
jgi:hypothetical protein